DVNQQLDKKVNVSDMRKPASDVAGIEEVNAKQDKLTITPADDSKVAHLSGANNFDTVPTVKNNPLLLASSLPSDLARTGQDANFTRKLQKSGVDVATTSDVTTAVNAITSNSINWTSLSVDSSQISDTDYVSNQANCSYRISHNTLYVSGQYAMIGNGISSHTSEILFKLPTSIVSQISFPSTNKFTIGFLQPLTQQISMMPFNLTNDGNITCFTNPHDLNTTYNASLAPGFINAAIPLN
ncbi:hypothetical protein HMPREF9103_02454, partial [Lentilactobacillus parafarraginis F0439]